VKKSRFLYFHEGTNKGKIQALEALQVEYKRYLQSCIDQMISSHRMKISKKELRSFFPKETILSTNIVTACQHHANEITSSWTSSLYTRKIKHKIKKLYKEAQIDEATKIALFTIGKYSIDHSSETIPQEAIDFYWTLLLDPKISGKTPTVSNRIGIRTSIHTSDIRKLEETKLASWWLGFSNLNKGKKIRVPLKANPHLNSPDEIVDGCLIRKDKRGRWTVGVLEKKIVEQPKLLPNMSKIGVDVGLNVLAATSDGKLYGEKVKPKFDELYKKVKNLRANRQRQDLKENSSKLDYLEDKLSGMIKTNTGEIANKLIKDFPNHVFVVEDLDLSGCKGQKRFAYRALQHSLNRKAPTISVNPAYTSQTCPSCGYVSRSNRHGTIFICKSCGKISHADVVGGINLLRRSEDKQIDLYDDPSEVKILLRERFRFRRKKRTSSLRELEVNEPYG
jgi:putative transposase